MTTEFKPGDLVAVRCTVTDVVEHEPGRPCYELNPDEGIHLHSFTEGPLEETVQPWRSPEELEALDALVEAAQAISLDHNAADDAFWRNLRVALDALCKRILE